MAARIDALVERGGSRLLIEPRRLAVVRGRPDASGFAVAAVCIGAFMGQLDASIVTQAFPTLQHSFHASLGAVTWVGLSYLLVLVASVAAFGRLSDMAGRKLVYLYGFALFALGSGLCGLAPDLSALIGFRVLQALGAAMLQANSVAIIAVAVPRRRLGRSLGIQGAAQAMGLALGPTVGGLLLDSVGWRGVFFVNVPVGVAGIALGWWCIPRSAHLAARARFDWGGLALFFPAVVAVLAAVSFANQLGWASAPVLGALAGGLLLVWAFVAWERRRPQPLVSLALFANRRFTRALLAALATYLVLFGVLLVVPYLLERGAGLGPGRAGLELMAMPLALGLVAPVAGRWSDRVGARRLTAGGLGLAAASLGALALAAAGSRSLATGALVPICLAGVGLGLGLGTSPNNATVMASVGPARAGQAAGLLNMTRGLGTALGLAGAGLCYGLAGGHSATAARHGVVLAVVFLGVVAVLGALVSSGREPAGSQADAALGADPRCSDCR